MGEVFLAFDVVVVVVVVVVGVRRIGRNPALGEVLLVFDVVVVVVVVNDFLLDVLASDDGEAEEHPIAFKNIVFDKSEDSCDKNRSRGVSG